MNLRLQGENFLLLTSYPDTEYVYIRYEPPCRRGNKCWLVTLYCQLCTSTHLTGGGGALGRVRIVLTAPIVPELMSRDQICLPRDHPKKDETVKSLERLLYSDDESTEKKISPQSFRAELLRRGPKSSILGHARRCGKLREVRPPPDRLVWSTFVHNGSCSSWAPSWDTGCSRSWSTPECRCRPLSSVEGSPRKRGPKCRPRTWCPWRGAPDRSPWKEKEKDWSGVILNNEFGYLVSELSTKDLQEIAHIPGCSVHVVVNFPCDNIA